jgi:hypothetical protein
MAARISALLQSLQKHCYLDEHLMPELQASLHFTFLIQSTNPHADMEKQHRVLVRWEQHVAEQRAGGGGDGSVSSPALRALKVGVPPPQCRIAHSAHADEAAPQRPVIAHSAWSVVYKAPH